MKRRDEIVKAKMCAYLSGPQCQPCITPSLLKGVFTIKLFFPIHITTEYDIFG
jgi:hypothetical protein